MGQWVGAQGQVKWPKKCKNTPTLDVSLANAELKICLDVNWKSCCIRRGFEQLSSSNG